MKYLTLLLLLIGYTASAQQNVKSILDSLSLKYQLELCYSNDLVDLEQPVKVSSDSMGFNEILKELTLQSKLTIEKHDSTLVITPLEKNDILISGKLIDMESGEEVPFAHILQKDWGTGTITNDVGKFELNVPQILAGMELRFSSMGYSDTTLIIPSSDSINLTIKIRPKPYNLKEVMVLPNGNSAVDLVKTAVKQIKRNYHRKTVQMDAFYRQIGMRENDYVNLIEAALLIEDKGINSSTETTKIKVEEMRKSTNYLIQHDTKHKLAYKVLDKIFGHRNIFYKCYNRNSVRNYRADWWYRPLMDYDHFEYEYEGAVWLDTMKVYKVKYTYVHIPESMGGGKIKYNNNWDGGYIYINSDDMAIVQLDNVWQFFESNPSYSTFKDGIMWKSTRSYQKIGDKYYLKYIKGLTYPNAPLYSIKKTDTDTIIKNRQSAEEILLITDVITDKRLQDRIKYKDKLARDEKTLEKKYPYHPDFWAHYNMVQLKPLPGKAIEDLEWEKSLDLQFEENGSHDTTNN
nr:carboxypeptidase-like regulatory domain-containing protein [uncultured Carboxylicivirga sp.]